MRQVLMTEPGCRRAVALVAVMLVVSACGSTVPPTSRTPSPTPIAFPMQARTLDLAQTAKALGDPKTAELGVWSVLAHIALGVHGTGGVLLAGSEASKSDFFLFDFQVPELAAMAVEPPKPFSDYSTYLTRFGSTLSEARVLKLYAAAYRVNPHAYLGQLFSALGMSFSSAPMLTLFEQWLLLLDLTPPNPQRQSSPVATNGDVVLESAHSGVAPSPCDLFESSGSAGWGMARGEAQTAAAAFSEGLSDVPAEAVLIANAVRVRVTNEPDTVQEGDAGPGQVEIVNADVSLQSVPNVVNCSALFPQLLGLLPFDGGPLRGAAVQWLINSDEAYSHGAFDAGAGQGASTTDIDGRSTDHFQTIEDPSHGKGRERQLRVMASASVDLKNALRAGGASELLLLALPDRVEGWSLPFTIVWHSDDTTWTGTLHMELTYGPGCSATASYQLALNVDKDGAVAGTSKGGGTYFRSGCGGADFPLVVDLPVSGHLTGSAFQLKIPINAPSAYVPVTVPLASPTTAHAQTTDVQGVRTYTIDLACSDC